MAPMKKIVFFGLLAFFLFNLVGFYGVFMSARLHHRQSMIRLFDGGGYTLYELDTIKLLLSVPYPVQDNGYERVDGEFEYQGEYYRLVSQRFLVDAVHIVIIRDPHQKRLQEALGDYVKTMTDEPASSGQPAKVRADFSKDYIVTFTSLASSAFGWTQTTQWGKGVSFADPSFNPAIPSPPPRG